MTRKEFSEIGCVFAQAQYSDVEFTKIRDRKIRKMFADTIKRRYKLWLKIQRATQDKKKEV
jgi:hypothetical protein